MSDLFKIEIEDGTILNPKHYDHKRAKNWVAIVESDKSQPGGLRRNFLKSAPGGRVFIGPASVGDWLEFAGDYYTGAGTKKADRQYGRIVEINGAIHLDECELKEVGKRADHPEVNPLAAYSDAQILAEAKNRGLI